MDKSPESFFVEEEAKKLAESFTYCFKAKIVFFSSNMEELFAGDREGCSEFCGSLRKKLKLFPRCCHQDKEMCVKCENKDGLFIYRCFSGLTETVQPVIIDRKLAGYAMLGQFRMNNSPYSPEIERAWLAAGCRKTQLDEVFAKLPCFSEIDMSNILRLFSMLVSSIVSRGYLVPFHPTAASLVEKWIDENLSAKISLDSAADGLHRSRSGISQALRRDIGVSFTQLVTLKRIERFESLAAKNPDIQIKEAAALAGFSDPFYFSSIYKKQRLVPPSVFIKSLRK